MNVSTENESDAIAYIGCAFDDLPSVEAKFRTIMMLLIDLHYQYIDPDKHEDALDVMKRMVLDAVTDPTLAMHMNKKGAMGNA